MYSNKQNNIYEVYNILRNNDKLVKHDNKINKKIKLKTDEELRGTQVV